MAKIETLNRLIADVATTQGQEDSLLLLLQAIPGLIRDAIAKADTDEDAVAKLADQLEAKVPEVQAAINANPLPPPPPAPTPDPNPTPTPAPAGGAQGTGGTPLQGTVDPGTQAAMDKAAKDAAQPVSQAPAGPAVDPTGSRG